MFPAERASDPIPTFYWGLAVIYASREGRLLEVLPRSLPPMFGLALDTDPTRRVETEQLLGVQYGPQDLAEAAAFFRLARRGIKIGCAKLVARAATLSAGLNQRILPNPRFRDVLHLVENAGALGASISHSGTFAALLFDAHDLGARERALAAVSCAKALGFASPFLFHTSRRLAGTSPYGKPRSS